MIFNTMIKSMENLIGSNVTNLIMKEVSSLVTYGTSVNTGHNNGLWKIFQDIRLDGEVQRARSSSTCNMVMCKQVKYGMEGSKQ